MDDLTSSTRGLPGLPGKPTQAGVIPFRVVGDRYEFCVITARKSRRWGFPKGAIPKGLSLEQAALLEALEEAGLVGELLGRSLGSFRGSKRDRVETITLFLMRVDGVKKTWKESKERERRWVTLSEAFELLDRPSLAHLLQVACERLGLDFEEGPQE